MFTCIIKRHQHWNDAWGIVWRIYSWCGCNCCRNHLDVQKITISNQKKVRLLIKKKGGGLNYKHKNMQGDKNGLLIKQDLYVL